MHKNGRASWKRSVGPCLVGRGVFSSYQLCFANGAYLARHADYGLRWRPVVGGPRGLSAHGGARSVCRNHRRPIVDQAVDDRRHGRFQAPGRFLRAGDRPVWRHDARLGLAAGVGLRPVPGVHVRYGVSSPLYSSPQMALMQRRVDPDCLGRVFGLYGAVCSWAMPVGLIFSTLFADSIGVTRCFVLVGAAMLVLAALSWSIKSIRTIDQH